MTRCAWHCRSQHTHHAHAHKYSHFFYIMVYADTLLPFKSYKVRLLLMSIVSRALSTNKNVTREGILIIYLLNDLADDAGADSPTSLTNVESQSLFNSNGSDKLNVKSGVITGHYHLRSLPELQITGNIGGSEKELRAVIGKEGRVSSTFILVETVNFSLELGSRTDRSWLGKDLSTLDILTLGTTEQRANVIARHSIIEQLLKHFNASARSLHVHVHTNNL
mmetsp:Transcript_39757/g.81774  ORF Transcript_39757/g.81774 Transcript_39757/m.81774 type:complete len:222 (+) Transcript_39757:71-736(+)